MGSMARKPIVHIATAKAEIERLATSGADIALVIEGAQPYAKACRIEAPSPPWDRTKYDILIAIPIAYDMGTGLDGFYLGLPYSFHGGEHNRLNGQIVTVGVSGRRCLGTIPTGNNSA